MRGLVLEIWLVFAGHSWVLVPAEVLEICNARSNQSVRLAAYYMEKRDVPASNLLKVKINEDETCSRKDYEAHILTPVRARI